MAAKQFYFERDGKEFHVELTEAGSINVFIVKREQPVEKRLAIFTELAIAYQVMAHLFLRNLKQI